VLLDLAYDDVIAKLHIGSWDKFVEDRTFDQVVDEIYGGLANEKNKPSRNAIEYLCTFNEICRLRNVVAHTATKISHSLIMIGRMMRRGVSWRNCTVFTMARISFPFLWISFLFISRMHHSP
jgi:hypothetical protein